MKAVMLPLLSLLLVPGAAGAAAKPRARFSTSTSSPASASAAGRWAGGRTLLRLRLQTPRRPIRAAENLRIHYAGSQPWTAKPQEFGLGDQAFPGAAAAGKHLRITAWVRTDGVDDGGLHGGAGLWLEAYRGRDEVLGVP